VLVIARDGREAEVARAIAPFGERLHFTIDHVGFDLVPALIPSGGPEA